LGKYNDTTVNTHDTGGVYMLHLLHIEANPLFRKSIKDMIESIGIQYYNASNKNEIYSVLENNKIDLIVTALELSDIKGEKLVEELNKTNHQNIPILVLTATDDLDIRKRLFRLGIIDYLIKDQLAVNRLQRYIETFMIENEYSDLMSKMQIAVVDDSLLTLHIIKRIFEMQGIKNVSYYSDPKEFIESHRVFDIYVIDLVLPGMSGEDLVYQLRKRNDHSLIVLISAINNYKTISHLLMSGADDYIMKPFDGHIFMARLRGHLRSYKLLTELREKNELLEELSITDGLTQLSNRQHLMNRLDEEISRASRYGTELTIILFDIDDFKVVNDTHGHLMGDEVLVRISQIIKENIRQSDIVGRYGGEEFMVVLPQTSVEEAFTVGDKIRVAIEAERFHNDSFCVTISGGISSHAYIKKSRMINVADAKLYEAKSTGKNKIIK